MTTYRKLIIIFYMIIVTVMVAIPILDGLGIIDFKEGTSWLVAQIITATAVPVAIAVLKTRDFFREDPYDVANLQKEHAKAMSEAKEAHRTEKTNLQAKHSEEAKALKEEVRKWQNLYNSKRTTVVERGEYGRPLK